MYLAIGMHSEKVYGKHKYKEALIRQLNTEFPSYASIPGHKNRDKAISHIYPEPLRIQREGKRIKANRTASEEIDELLTELDEFGWKKVTDNHPTLMKIRSIMGEMADVKVKSRFRDLALYDTEGNLIRRFSSTQHAAVSLNISQQVTNTRIREGKIVDGQILVEEKDDWQNE